MHFSDFIFGISICFLLSFILGLERQVRRRSLGLRTMILVALGSYMFVSLSFLITGYQIDITRIAAGVVAGIGFLGAGVIIKDNEKNQVKGLTTAATLWCDSAIGVMCAAGFIKEAIVSSIFVLLTNIILRYINSTINNRVEQKNIIETFIIKFKIDKNSTKVIEEIINFDNKSDNIDNINYKIDGNDVEIIVNVKKSNDSIINNLIDKIVNSYSIKSYELKKISEAKSYAENDELWGNRLWKKTKVLL